MSPLLQRLAREAQQQLTYETENVWTERIETAVAGAIRAALREAVRVARTFEDSPEDNEAGTASNIAAAIEDLAKEA